MEFRSEAAKASSDSGGVEGPKTGCSRNSRLVSVIVVLGVGVEGSEGVGDLSAAL